MPDNMSGMIFTQTVLHSDRIPEIFLSLILKSKICRKQAKITQQAKS